VSALASLDDSTLAVMVWHYHDDDVAGPDADVSLTLAGLPAAASGARVTHYRIDDTHSNAYGAWKAMGSPIAPNDAQYARLLDASKLTTVEQAAPRTTNAGSELTFRLPRQGVSLIVLDWAARR